MEWSHSHSSVSDFETCERQFQAKRITKEVKFLGNEYSKYGDRFHTALEERICCDIDLPTEFAEHEDVVAAVFRFPGERFCELKLAITRDYKPCDWYSDEPKPYFRSIIDFVAIDGVYARMLDWKTGKQKDDSDQLAEFALMLFIHHPILHVIDTGFVWFKTKKVVKEKFTRADIPSILARIKTKTERIEHAIEANKFVPNPSGLCRNYCEVHSCVFNGHYTGPK